MAIKDILQKASKPGDANNPKVQQLRAKLQKLQQQKKEQATAKPDQKPQQAAAAPIQSLASDATSNPREYVQQDHPELKLREQRTGRLMAKQIGEMIQLTTDLNKRLMDIEKEREKAKQEVQRIEKQNDDIREKMAIIDQRLEKFMGLYEVITNQYNPFAEKDAMPQSPPMKTEPAETAAAPQISVTDNLTGEQTSVPIEQGQMSSENARKMSELLAELEEKEREKRTADADKREELTVREEETKQDLLTEMHAMFTDFEQRLTRHIDDSLQEKIHDTFSILEETLAHEVEEAISEEVSDLKENEKVIEDALQEIAGLEEQATEPQEYKEEVQVIQEEVRHVDEQIKAVPPSLYFRLHDGRILKDKSDLALALQTMPEEVFMYHVNGDRNDFADWLEMALQDSVGEALRGKNQEQMATVLSS